MRIPWLTKICWKASIAMDLEDVEKRKRNFWTAQTSFTGCTCPLLILGRSRSQDYTKEWLSIIQASTRPSFRRALSLTMSKTKSQILRTILGTRDQHISMVGASGIRR